MRFDVVLGNETEGCVCFGCNTGSAGRVEAFGQGRMCPTKGCLMSLSVVDQSAVCMRSRLLSLCMARPTSVSFRSAMRSVFVFAAGCTAASSQSVLLAMFPFFDLREVVGEFWWALVHLTRGRRRVKMSPTPPCVLLQSEVTPLSKTAGVRSACAVVTHAGRGLGHVFFATRCFFVRVWRGIAMFCLSPARVYRHVITEPGTCQLGS